MPPLILDEPTVFLDSGHVTQLIALVESMRELGVEQIVVVSHDEELVGAADSLVRVEKDATSNRSRLERGGPGSGAACAGVAVEIGVWWLTVRLRCGSPVGWRGRPYPVSTRGQSHIVR